MTRLGYLILYWVISFPLFSAQENKGNSSCEVIQRILSPQLLLKKFVTANPNLEESTLRSVLTVEPDSLAYRIPQLPDQISDIQQRFIAAIKELETGTLTAREKFEILMKLKLELVEELELLKKASDQDDEFISFIEFFKEQVSNIFNPQTIMRADQNLSSEIPENFVDVSKLGDAFVGRIKGILSEFEVLSFKAPVVSLEVGVNYKAFLKDPIETHPQIQGEIDLITHLGQNLYRWIEVKAYGIYSKESSVYEKVLDQAKKQRTLIEIQRKRDPNYQVAVQDLIVKGGMPKRLRELMAQEMQDWVSYHYPETAELTKFEIFSPEISN